MNINTSPKRLSTSRPSARVSQHQTSEASPDSVTLGAGKALKSIGGGLIMGALGAVPAVGAVSNGLGGIGAGLKDFVTPGDNSGPADAASWGVLANIAGTLTMVGGALTGNDTAMKVSYGLLGASALAGVYVGAS